MTAGAPAISTMFQATRRRKRENSVIPVFFKEPLDSSSPKLQFIYYWPEFSPSGKGS
jgi:hypothetical protein